MVCWDAVTGDGADFPWRFSAFLFALGHMAAYEREHDRSCRTQGALTCRYVGFAGSADADFEGLRSSRFQLGLRRIALRVIRRG